jgi:hypothetical protein
MGVVRLVHHLKESGKGSQFSVHGVDDIWQLPDEQPDLVWIQVIAIDVPHDMAKAAVAVETSAEVG